MRKSLRSLAGRTLSTSTDAEEKSLAAYVLQDGPDSGTAETSVRSKVGRTVRHLGDTQMADAKPEDKVTDPKKIDLEAAKSLVEQDRADSKDGVAAERTEAGIVLTPQSPDKSVATYNPAEVQKAEDVKPQRNKKYESGEPVHDRS